MRKTEIRMGTTSRGERRTQGEKKTEERDPWNSIDGEVGILDDSHTSRSFAG